MAKVEDVQTSQVIKAHKAKHKQKKSKSKRHRTKRTGLEQAKSEPVKPSPKGHVHDGVRVRKATISESPELSQIGRKEKHKSTYKSQPSKVAQSNLVEIARYVQLAHKALGRTATAAYTKNLRRSIHSGISAALKEAQINRTSQPEQIIKQKLRDKVLKCIKGRSLHTKFRQVLVTLDDFIQALQVQVTAAQQSVAGQMGFSPGEGQQKAPGEDQKDGDGPGQVYYTPPQDSQVQWHKNTTFSRDFILIIWRRSVLVRLRAMNKEDFLSIVDSAFQRVSPHSDSSRALSEACLARNAARDEIQKVRFAPDSEGEDYPQLINSCTHQGKNLGSTISHPHSKEVREKIRHLRQEVIALEEGLTSGMEFGVQCSMSTAVPSKKLKSRSKISEEVKQTAALAELPPASNGKRESHKRKAKENTTDIAQPEAAIDSKRFESEDSAFDQFGYQCTPGYWGPRERGGEMDRSQ
ncbi:hypothetical protein JMJ35_001249 [Cladonia borealis]|uniref:Uncharacterized protein n=1 Tax=Cladonia borealis TaxID=184061 RepID=A0AA39R9K7_9LECA|nr:hypothetical protein JMJ35_001249 [Cladonia borealis]